ncbi:DUF4145 domain-containing protein [Nocardioides eburneiflavus]|nr:DUF4145 domain-containing protein [Nocardioides eburneiflavus]
MSDGLPPKSEHELPDSTYPYGPCPRCGRASNFTPQGTAPVTFDESGGYSIAHDGHHERIHEEQLVILQCQGCRQNVVVVEEQYVGGQRKRDGGRSGVVEWRGVHWWPSPGMRRGDPDIPRAVADAIAEAERCLSANSPRAAAVMFRGALAEIVTQRGSETARAKGSLYAQLGQMASDGDLDDTLADWADHVRVLGNAGAHPLELEPVSRDEADELSRLVNALVEYLFVHPARVRRARAGRQ